MNVPRATNGPPSIQAPQEPRLKEPEAQLQGAGQHPGRLRFLS